jgi:hypothetical protein
MIHMKMLRSTFLALAAITLIGVGPARAMSSPLAAGKTTSVKTYLVAIGDNGRSGKRIGCGDSLIAVTRHIAPTSAPLTALRLLLSDHHRFYGQSGLYNALYQSRLTVKHVAVQNRRATIQLTGRMHLGGVCDDPRVGAQLRRTAFQFPTVHSVAIFVNGVPLKRRLSEK